MKATRRLLLVLLAVGVFVLPACSDDDGADTDGDACSASGNWYDPATELCWQNPPSSNMINWDDALTNCDNLSLGGYDDWRLPKVQELISLLRGCVDGTMTDDLSISECGVTDPDCLEDVCSEEGCGWCEFLEGPGSDPEGSYWDPALTGGEDWYWSSSSSPDDEANAWYVYFSGGHIGVGPKDLTVYGRCVRSGP